MDERWVCKRCFAANDGAAPSCAQCGLLRGAEPPAGEAGTAQWPAAAQVRQPWWRPLLRFWWVGAIGVALLVGVITSAQRDESGEITRAGTVSINDLRIGDCFDSDDVAEISDVEGKPCAEPHEFELYHIVEWSGSDDEYPSELEMETLVGNTCLPAFDEYVGMAYEISAIHVMWTSPSEDGWRSGDRAFQCALFDPANSELTGSLRGASR